MADHRKHIASLCVKNSAKTGAKIEVFAASEWPDSAQSGALGGFRLRVNRKWHNGPDGNTLFLQPADIGALIMAHALGAEIPALEPPPDLPRKTRVSVPNGKTLAGETLYDGSRTETDPLRGYDGRWWVNVVTPSLGCTMVAVDTLILHKGK